MSDVRPTNQPQKPKKLEGEPSFGELFHAWLENHKASLVDSFLRLVKHPFASFFTCLVIAVTLSLPMGLSIILKNINELAGSWQQAAQISLFLHLDVDDEKASQLQNELNQNPDIENTQLITKKQALAEFQEQTGLGEALQALPSNPLPSVIVVTPKELVQNTITELQHNLQQLPEVDRAELDMQWLERLMSILKLGERFVFGISVLLIAALLLVIGNTIRLAIENRRAEIEVIKLVGGTDGYVRRPFIYMGALYGLGAGLFAWALLAFGLNWINTYVVQLAGLYASDFKLSNVSLEDALSLIIGAILLGWIGAWLAVARHLRELAPR
ncbi:permease-like cell division protein FtsX [Entomomonas asaccharolytica]|uniref:Cell division protein FtsX n=1 Tax=Entomomonas asaccharolytica TaxID=2785331 RepID=A0A974RWQ1_9GAMM|nr:permease-like cell division protein FtsX [Entomomonas asaccharolytica]QQP85446.1 cell division protein FtsX [Entomomonas asaccharolytica]